jgi:hypothetical protein
MTQGEGTILDHRPIYQEILRRCDVDWGTAPRYTQEYRSLRWPAAFESRPYWIQKVQREIDKKRSGRWNNNRFKNEDTRCHFVADVNKCMGQNIPYKGNKVEYKPSTQKLYYEGRVIASVDIEKGTLASFGYGGKYCHQISYILRNLFYLNIFKVQGEVVFSPGIRYLCGQYRPRETSIIGLREDFELVNKKFWTQEFKDSFIIMNETDEYIPLSSVTVNMSVVLEKQARQVNLISMESASRIPSVFAQLDEWNRSAGTQRGNTVIW